MKTSDKEKIIKYICKRFNKRSDEDFKQEINIRFWLAEKRIKEKNIKIDNDFSYFTTVLKNIAINIIEYENRRPLQFFDFIEERDYTPKIYDLPDINAENNEMWEKMPLNKMHFIGNFTYKEIAIKLGLKSKASGFFHIQKERQNYLINK